MVKVILKVTTYKIEIASALLVLLSTHCCMKYFNS